MGIGHYYPDNWRTTHYRMINLMMSANLGYSYDNPEYADNESNFHQDFWEELIHGMQARLHNIAPTGNKVNEWSGDALVIYRTPLMEVTLVDNQVLFAIAVKTRSDFDGEPEANLAPRHIDRVAQKLFDYLQDTYGKLSVPYGGYLSGVWDGKIESA